MDALLQGWREEGMGARMDSNDAVVRGTLQGHLHDELGCEHKSCKTQQYGVAKGFSTHAPRPCSVTQMLTWASPRPMSSDSASVYMRRSRQHSAARYLLRSQDEPADTQTSRVMVQLLCGA